MFFSENLDIYIAGEFGSLALVNSVSATENIIYGIFDKNYQAMFDGISEGRQISFLTRTDKCEGLRHGDGLLIEGIDYQITEIKPVDDGALTLILLKQ